MYCSRVKEYVECLGAGSRTQKGLLLDMLHGDAVVCHSKCGIMQPEDDTPDYLGSLRQMAAYTDC